MTKKDKNLKDIMESLPSDTPEITYVVLKSQCPKKGYRKSLL